MSKIVKNTTGSPITPSGTGQEVLAGESFTIQPIDYSLWASLDSVVTLIGSGDFLVNDGALDLSISDGTDLIKGYFPTEINLGNKTAVQGIPRVAVYRPEGSSSTMVSHDWTDPTTWYKQSIRVTGEVLILDVGKVYDFINPNVIDLTHGNLYDEDNLISGYELKIYDNAIEKTEGTDYTMDYVTGKVTFDAGYTIIGSITADYSYENGSCWVLAPLAGKVLHIEHAELNFSKNVQMSQVAFEIWVYNPADLPNKMMYQRVNYKNIKDIINSANLGQGVIPAIDMLTQDILVFPFNYTTVKSLKYSDGAELRVQIGNDTAFAGEFATATFYVLSEDL